MSSHSALWELPEKRFGTGYLLDVLTVFSVCVETTSICNPECSVNVALEERIPLFGPPSERAALESL
jgi:hypothetical protein